MKKIIKIIAVAITLISSIAWSQVLDATRVSSTRAFTANTDTNANRAAASANTLAQDAMDAARNSNAAGVIAALIDKKSCVYETEFDCTIDNLTHVYETKTWSTPGSYSWRVPADIKEVYVKLIGGGGGGGISDNITIGVSKSCNNCVQGDKNRNDQNFWSGRDGSNSSFKNLIARGGKGEQGTNRSRCRDCLARGGESGLSLIETIPVLSNQIITVKVGDGGLGGRVSSGVRIQSRVNTNTGHAGHGSIAFLDFSSNDGESYATYNDAGDGDGGIVSIKY